MTRPLPPPSPLPRPAQPAAAAALGGFSYVDHLPAGHDDEALARDARAGLTSTPKSLPPRWFYDSVGSALFEQITRLPEYYPTRAERSLLAAEGHRIVSEAGCDTLVELGSGSSEKTRLLLEPLLAASVVPAYVAVDVSETALLDAGRRLAADYPGLPVTAVRADFDRGLDALPAGGRRLLAFLGGTIGNLGPPERATFLRRVRAHLGPGDRFLLGADLVKSPDVLVPAYDDAAGVTAAFNRNVLAVLNRRLGADFDLRAFGHVAVWDAENHWIEMRLRSTRPQQVRVPALDLTVDFAVGEEMRTEISTKFEREPLTAELAAAGLALEAWHLADEGYSLGLWRPSSRATLSDQPTPNA